MRTDIAISAPDSNTARTIRPAPLIAILALAACGDPGPGGGSEPGRAPAAAAMAPIVTEQRSGTSDLLQAVSVVDERTVWVSGHGGTWARTLDGGTTWNAGVVPGADTLQFRDVHAVDSRTAYLLGAGPGEMSRVYRTDDDGASWTLQHVNPEPDGFYDCMDFWSPREGVLYGDAVGGELRVLLTRDGGTTWRGAPVDGLPAAQPGEGGFAASGTCAVAGSAGNAWIGTGASAPARVLRTIDGGATWRAVAAPLAGGESAGIMTLSFWDDERGVALGGDLADPAGFQENAAATTDGGESWRLADGLPFPGAAYGSAIVPGEPSPTVVAVGPGGAAYSTDGGITWSLLDDAGYWAVGAAGPGAIWLVGPGGRITKVALR